MTTETTFECAACDGRGEVDTGAREPLTGAIIGRPCEHCNGTGEVGVQQTICDGCDQVTSIDTLCTHRSSDLCPACAADCCRECIDLARYDDVNDPWRDQAVAS